MIYRLSPGQIAYVNRMFERINRAKQYEETADEISLVQTGQKILKSKREGTGRKRRMPRLVGPAGLKR